MYGYQAPDLGHRVVIRRAVRVPASIRQKGAPAGGREPGRPCRLRRSPSAQPGGAAPADKPTVDAGAAKPAEQSASSSAAPAVAAASEIKAQVDTSLFQAVWSNKGGVLLSWKLKKHLDDKKQPLELVPRITETLGIHPFSLLDETGAAAPSIDFAAIQANPLNASFYEIDGTDLVLKDGQKGSLRFRYSDGQGLEVEKIFTFTGGSYEFQTDIRVLRGTASPSSPASYGAPASATPPQKRSRRASAAAAA